MGFFSKPFQLEKQALNNISTYRFFIRQLVRINLLAAFKKSFIGWTWLIIMPILTVLVWVLLHGAGIVSPGKTDIPYPAYVLLSTSIWGFFIDIYAQSSTTISGGGRMMVMNKFPGEVLIAEKVVVHLIRFSIPLMLNLLVLWFFGVRFSWHAFLFPISLLPLLLLGLALGQVIAVFRVLTVDIVKIVDEFMKLLMFLTPVVFAPKLEVGWMKGFVDWNPLTYLIGFSRELLTKGQWFETSTYLLVSASCVFLYALSLRFYLRTYPKVLERLINN